MMTSSSKPFLRADQVGSLLRPQALLDARAQFQQGKLTVAQLRAAEDAAIRALAKQEEGVGLQVIVDGEYRRENWWIDFVSAIGGTEIRDGHESQAFTQKDACDHEWHYVPRNVVTVGKLNVPEPILAKDFAYLRGVTDRVAKITIPSPSRLHFHGGRDAVSREAYPDIEEFFADVAAIYQREIAALEAAGCRYIQIDDPLLTYFISDHLREEIRQAGEDPDERLRRYVELTNACISKRKPETALGIHLCRGNSKSGWITEGGYERVAETVFGGLKVDHFLLEYDDERSGDFHPLRFVPQGQKVVLGLVTTKHGNLEKQDDLMRRVDEATRYVPLENLAISPQCGFASVVEGNLITEEMQWNKLRLVVDTAQRIWGQA